MDPALGIAAARLAIGGAALTVPSLGARLLRLDPVANPQLPYLIRLFGSREIVVGATVLLATGAARRHLVLAGVAVDAADAAASVLAVRSGAIDRSTGTTLTAPAAAAVVAGLLGARAGR